MHRTRTSTLLIFVLCALLTGAIACGDPEPETAPASADPEDDSFGVSGAGKADANGVEEHSYEALCVLNLVNSGSTGLLVENGTAFAVSLGHIISHRQGPDEKFGTADDVMFRNLEELDAVPFVGRLTFGHLHRKAEDNGFCPTLGQEFVMHGEDEAIERVKVKSEAFIRETYATERPARRDAHAKEHGCVTAFVDIDNSALTSEEKVGIFAANKQFPAWIRFSNGSFHVQGDGEKDVRGMAIKLMGVEGQKILNGAEDAKTQDILLINSPTMFVRNPIDYIEFSEKALDGNPISFFLKLNPAEWQLRELFNLLAVVTKEPTSPLDSRYWSTTPYRLGAEDAIKYSARPCAGEEEGAPDDAGENYLKDTMSAQLETGEGCFELMIQRQLDPESMPIEDPTFEWDEGRSPFIKVATINIPSQEFLGAERQDFCEHLSFTPWHSLPEHKPLGGINRVRLNVYEGISGLRHMLNEEPREEPTSHEIP